jgi:hypothetical protein
MRSREEKIAIKNIVGYSQWTKAVGVAWHSHGPTWGSTQLREEADGAKKLGMGGAQTRVFIVV